MKEELRESINEQLNSIRIFENKTSSNIIINKVLEEETFQKANRIHCYVSFGKEVRTIELLKRIIELKDVVMVPYFENGIKTSKLKKMDLVLGKLGILEPRIIEEVTDKNLDVVILPGIAFDVKGNRLGRGKGHYDRFLEGCDAFKIGLAYDFQIISDIPSEKHDIKVNKIITEKRTIEV